MTTTPKPFSPTDPLTWQPRHLVRSVIAHDVATTRDRSTALLAATARAEWGPETAGMIDAERLPQDQYGTARAASLAKFDAQHGSRSIIVADVSNDVSYKEDLAKAFGARVICVSISRNGASGARARELVAGVPITSYVLGRTELIDGLHARMSNGQFVLPQTEISRDAFNELADLERVISEAGNVIYKTRAGKHDDLGMSMAIAAWAINHQDFDAWVAIDRQQKIRTGQLRINPRSSRAGSSGWT